jgi:hypothetical protein
MTLVPETWAGRTGRSNSELARLTNLVFGGIPIGGHSREIGKSADRRGREGADRTGAHSGARGVRSRMKTRIAACLLIRRSLAYANDAAAGRSATSVNTGCR